MHRYISFLPLCNTFYYGFDVLPDLLDLVPGVGVVQEPGVFGVLEGPPDGLEALGPLEPREPQVVQHQTVVVVVQPERHFLLFQQLLCHISKVHCGINTRLYRGKANSKSRDKEESAIFTGTGMESICNIILHPVCCKYIRIAGLKLFKLSYNILQYEKCDNRHLWLFFGSKAYLA